MFISIPDKVNARIQRIAKLLVKEQYDSLKEFHTQTFHVELGKKHPSGKDISDYIEGMSMESYEDACYIAGVIDGIKLLSDKVISE